MTEKSCGIIVYTKSNEEIRYVIICHKSLHHGFPKGHVEKGETEEDTALREVNEEIGITPIIIEGFKETISYRLPFKNTIKEVVYFLGYTEQSNLKIQENELVDGQFLTFEEALDTLEHEQSKSLLRKAETFLRNYYL